LYKLKIYMHSLAGEVQSHFQSDRSPEFLIFFGLGPKCATGRWNLDEFALFAAVHSSRRKFLIRIQFKKATTIAAKSADRNIFRTLHLRARPERLVWWTLVPAANTILRMVMEIRNEPLNHRPFALRTDAWFAHMRLPYRIAANHGNVFFAWTQRVRQAMPNVIPAMDGKALRGRARSGSNAKVIVGERAEDNGRVLGQWKEVWRTS
jgi:hypothetical protein